MIDLLLALITSYIIGSIPTSYLVGKTKGIDVRKTGSGNTGASNVLRTVGKIPAVITLVADILKGVVAVTLIASYFYGEGSPVGWNAYRALLGLSVIAGHNRSIFLIFKGGRGVATSIGVLAILLPGATVVGIFVFLVSLAITKYISLGSILLSMTIPLTAALSGEEMELILLAVTICVIISYKHKDNIKRLLRGTERKIGKK